MNAVKGFFKGFSRMIATPESAGEFLAVFIMLTACMILANKVTSLI